MASEACLEAIPREGLSDEDRAFLEAWVRAMGDDATVAGVRGRIRALLGLRDEHPGRPPLAALMDDPTARAVLLARPEGRAGVRARWRRSLREK